MARGKIGAVVLALAALVAGHGAWAQKGLLPSALTEVSYGTHPRQTLAFARPNLNRATPLFVFVHGGAWMIGDKSRNSAPRVAWLAPRGWAYATVNYRLVPEVRVEDQAADVARAIAWLRSEGARRGLDGDRIVLAGHSAGAHLAALVASDPRYLKAAGVPMHAIDGVLLLDGAAYDVEKQMAGAQGRRSSLYEPAFGRDPARQRALSPIHHASAPNAGKWLILPVAGRADSVAQSEALAAALRKAGGQAVVRPQSGKTHRSINVELGTAGDPATAIVERWLGSLSPPR